MKGSWVRRLKDIRSIEVKDNMVRKMEGCRKNRNESMVRKRGRYDQLLWPILVRQPLAFHQ